MPVRVVVTDGQCRYWNTDVGLNAVQLEDHLVRGTNKSLRIDFLTDGIVPETCVIEGIGAAYRSGFRTFFVRPKTRSDDAGDPLQ